MNFNNDKDFLDLIIIGGGPAGLTAGIYAKRAALNTVLIEKDMCGGQIAISDEIENWPGIKKIKGQELSSQFAEHARSYDLEIMTCEVIEIVTEKNHHVVRLKNGRDLKAYSIILSTGGTPRKLNIPGESENYGKGVSYCATCDGFFFTDRTVVVVGGGDTATEEALYLAKLAKQVYLVHHRNEFRASRLLQERVKNEKRIKVIFNSVLTKIQSDDTAVCSVELNNVKEHNTSELDTDGVFIFIGFEPNNKIIPAGVKLNTEGYVVTDEKCETAIDGIFAVGDLREKYARQIVTAVGDGATATLAAAHYVEVQKARIETSYTEEHP